MPPAIDLPIVTMSGYSPQARVQPPGPALNVCVSSLISSVPYVRVSARTASRKPGAGSTMPMLVSAGSISTAATSPARELPLQRVQVVELHDAGRLRGSTGRADVPVPRARRRPALATMNVSSTLPW